MDTYMHNTICILKYWYTVAVKEGVGGKDNYKDGRQ